MRPSKDDLVKWTPVMQKAALLYSRCESKHLIVTCRDGFTLDVFCPIDRFMHLCGVSEYRSMTILRERGPVGFYRAAIEMRLEPDGMKCLDERDDVKTKMKLICSALDFTSSVKLVVEGNYRRMTAFIGCEKWSIGLYEDKSESAYSTSGKVMMPGSLTSRSVRWKHFTEKGCEVKEVETITIVH